jgi:type IV pilus assembly protein PilX
MKYRVSGCFERGMVLITSLLLLVVVTILGVALFRSFGVDEKIAGNNREKQLALNYAESAEQYAEWWLMTGANGAGFAVINNCGTTVLTATVTAPLGQACLNAIPPTNLTTPSSWTSRVDYTPPNLGVTNLTSYYKPPAFYINYFGNNGLGNYYRIDAVGYGGSPNTVAIVESTFRCSQKITGFSGPGNKPPPLPTSC